MLNIQNIETGMSYDEVRNELGPPLSIGRGISMFMADGPEDYQSSKEEWRAIQRGVKNSKHFRVFGQSLSVSHLGQSMYVNWPYNHFTTETVFVVRPRYRDIPGTGHLYLVNNYSVSKKLFESITDTFFSVYEMGTTIGVTREDYYFRQSHKSELLRRPEVAVKEIRKNWQPPEKGIVGSYEEPWVIKNQFQVIFDAQSGRVTMAANFPVEITKASIR